MAGQLLFREGKPLALELDRYATNQLSIEMAESIFKVELHWSIWLFLFYVGGTSFLIRALMSALRAWEIENENPGLTFSSAFGNSIAGRGFSKERWHQNDYWHPFILGTFELIAYPILLAGGKPQYIAGWLVLKTLPQWARWQERRQVYNRFLIGNALVIMFSYFASILFFGVA